MEKRFRVLRIIGTLWKVIAWLTLIAGILSSLGILAVGALGRTGFILRLFERQTGVVPGSLGIVSSILGFVLMLAGAIIYFLILYAVGELIYLWLAIEENTRRTMRLMQENTEVKTPPPMSPPSSSPEVTAGTEE